jgi:hypothetical protein
MVGLSDFWGYCDSISLKEERGIVMRFFWHSGTDPTPLKSRIDEGLTMLEGLMTGGQWSVHLKPRGVGSLTRTDKETETSLTVELRGVLSENIAERYELTVFDASINGLLDRRGVFVNVRAIYNNFGREVYRLTKQYRDQELKTQIQSLQANPIYSQLDQNILISISMTVAGV